MFVQIIQGPVSDPAKARVAVDRWVAELAPSATGWLGITAGVTDNGMFTTIVRFESEEAARHNSDRPEQGQWWAEAASVFTSEPTFRDSVDVLIDVAGDPDQAGFVQLIQARSTDPEQTKQLMVRHADQWAAFRPDIIGRVVVRHSDDTFTMAMYFTSEQAAREGERTPPPAALKERMEKLNAREDSAPDFLDLKQPWLYSAR